MPNEFDRRVILHHVLRTFDKEANSLIEGQTTMLHPAEYKPVPI